MQHAYVQGRCLGSNTLGQLQTCSRYCPGVVCCPGPLVVPRTGLRMLSAAGVSAWRFQHWGHGQLLGEGCSKPWSFSGKNYICKCLNADGGGKIKYCDSLWCGASVEGNSAVYHRQLGHWHSCKTRSGVRQSAALGEISTGGSAGALLHLSAFCTALSQTLQLYAALLLAVWCG